MKTKKQMGETLLVALFACGLAACTTSEAKDDGTGGAAGGATGAAGAAGATGAAGSTGAAGTTGAGTGSDGVLCPLPAAPLITDFAAVAGATDTTQVHFGDSTTLGGGEYAYPGATSTTPLKSDVSQGNWHLSGTIGDYSGFGLYWDNCTRVDASAYKGISFTISGSIPATQSLTMGVATVGNSITADWLIANKDPDAKAGDPGRCVPPAGTTNKYAQSACKDSEKVIPVTATPTPVTILWSDFAKGAPTAAVNPKEIVRMSWFFSWNGAGSATYPVDITIDDLSFIP